MDKLISSEKLIHDLSGIRDTLPDIFLKNVMSAAISCVENQEGVEAVTVSELNEIGRMCGFRAEYKSGILFFDELHPWNR